MKQKYLHAFVVSLFAATACALASEPMLDRIWNGVGEKSEWIQKPSGKLVGICKNEEYHKHKIFEINAKDGNIAMPEKPFQIFPGKRYVLYGMIRSVSAPGANTGKKGSVQKNAKSSIFDGSAEILQINGEGKKITIAKKPLRFTNVWEHFYILFELPNTEKESSAATIAIKIDKPDGYIQMTKMRVSEGNAKPLSIGKYVNRSYQNTAEKTGWVGDLNHDVRNFKGGNRTFAEIPFEIPKEGAIGLSQKPGFHKSIEIPLEQADFIYILNTAAIAPRKKHVGTVRWNFANGISVENKVISGFDIGDWFNVRMQKARDAFSVEQFGVCPGARSVHFFVTSLWNPRMKKALKSITLECSSDKDPVWLVMGLAYGFGGNIAGVREAQTIKK